MDSKFMSMFLNLMMGSSASSFSDAKNLHQRLLNEGKYLLPDRVVTHAFRVNIPNSQIEISISCVNTGYYEICIFKDTIDLCNYNNDVKYFDTYDSLKNEIDRLIGVVSGSKTKQTNKPKLLNNYYSVLCQFEI